jgi:hypothetical protein
MKSWAFSSLLNFERCPLSVTFPYRKADNEFTARGTELHTQAETYAKNPEGDCPWPALEANFKSMQAPGQYIVTEPSWGFDKDWHPVAYKSAWAKIRPDLVVVADDKVTVIDYKSGKRHGNELKHTMQVQLYTCAAAILYPAKQYINELWYLDLGQVVQGSIPAGAAMDHVRERWTRRALKMTEATDFPPKPSKGNCRYCFERDRCEFVFEE